MKITKRKQTSYASASLKDADLLDYTLWTQNYLKVDGAYRTVLSGNAQSNFLSCQTGTVSLHYSQGLGMLFAYLSSGVYRLKRGISGWTQVMSSPPEKPFFIDMYIDGEMTCVCFSGTKRTSVTAGGYTTTTDTRSFSAGVIHCGRFFGVEGNDGFRLCWSQSTPFEWDDGIYGSGYIRLPAEGGEIRRLFSYGDRLIAMRESGITVIRAYGEPQHYKVDATADYLIAGGIIADTCAICAGRIFFCTAEGIFSFDGSSVAREVYFIDCGVSAPIAAAACGSKYVVMCTHDKLGEGVVYFYDKSLGDGCICNISPDYIFEGPDGMYFSYARVIRFFGTRSSGVWYSREVRFGGGQAFLKSVDLDCDGDCTLTVSSLGVSRTFEGGGRHAVNMYGEAFTFSVKSDGPLRALTARAEA